MSYSIIYLLDSPARPVLQELSVSNIPHPNIEPDHPIEIKLWNNWDCIIYSGLLLTQIWTPIKYSAFLANPEIQTIVNDFELWLIAKFSPIRILRVDEFLIEKFEFMQGENWHQTPEAYDILFSWIQNEENLHWKKIN